MSYPDNSLSPGEGNSFADLREELSRRLRAPFFNFTYWTHLILGVFFYGAIGVWTEALRRYYLNSETTGSNILLAMHTTYPAIIGATAMQLTLNGKEKSYIRSFANLVSTAFVAMAVFSIVAADNIDKRLSFWLALFGIGSAATFWWISNAFNEGLKDADPSDAIGGPLPSEKAIVAAFSADEHSTAKTPLGPVKL